MKRDIKILELNKQHYFDQYNTQMKCDYSCWGYYDGLKIIDAPVDKNKLFKKKTNAPVSPIWFGMGECIEGLQGKFSKQNIGIFRDPEKNSLLSQEFWGDVYGQSPYFAVAFIQLYNKKEFHKVSEDIEALGFGQDIVNEKYCKLLAYYTFDNAEIVGLIRSNSLKELGRTINNIEKNPKISYIHSILGVSEKYLEECIKSKKIISEWKGINCNIRETVAEVMIKIVTSGQHDTIGKIRTILQEQYNGEETKIQYSYLTGHGSVAFRLPKTTVGSVLRMMLPDGLLTHSNTLYGKEIYNIETELFLESNRLDAVERKEILQEKDSMEKMWCEALIEKYIIEMRRTLENQEEGLYSYYRALVQTLNTLMQYEGFALSENIFFYLYPAFEMFDKLLNHALKELRDPQKKYEIRDVKESICEFLTAVNSIIYHMIHTDQVFLMVPGYSGSFYSIPIKLCMMYLGIAENVISLLNEKDAAYTCLLTPETEVRPISSPLDMGIYSENRLIKFASSQRSLYMPRHFILILTHEIAHYVGSDIRMREFRCEKIIRTLACYLTEGIFPEAIPTEIDPDIYLKICEKIKKDVREECVEYLQKKVNQSCMERRYFGDQLEEILMEGCQKYLASHENGVGKHFDKIFVVMECEEEEKLLDYSEKLYRQREWLNHNRTALLHSGIMKYFIETVLRVYREIFSDVAAMTILNCDIETFSETWDVSEGVKVESQENENYLYCARKSIIERAFFKEKKDKSESEIVYLEKLDQDWPLHYHEEVYEYEWLGTHLLDYAEECKKCIEKQISKSELNDSLKEIRAIFKMFTQDENTCCEIYSKIMECIETYTEKVKEKYNLEINALKKTDKIR